MVSIQLHLAEISIHIKYGDAIKRLLILYIKEEQFLA
jgi:hypothetical protein